MTSIVAKSSVVSDRELEQDKSDDTSGSRIRCPLCGWSPRKEDKWFCTCGTSGTRSIRAESAQLAFTSEPRRNAYHVAAGRHIRSGVSGNLQPNNSNAIASQSAPVARFTDKIIPTVPHGLLEIAH
jgi:hypothetical protein